MIKPPLRPQAVTHQGCIYCMDSDKDWGDSARTCIEMYNPANGKWKQSGNGKSFVFDTATLVKHGGSLYIFMVQIIGAHDCWIVVGLPKKSLTYVNQYHPETDSWLNVTDKDSLVLPSTLMKWLGSGNTGNRTDCLVARLIPQCLGKRTLVEDLVAEMFPDEEEESNDSSDSYGSGVSDDSDSEDDLSYQEDSDEDNSDEDRQSGSDEEDV